MAKAALMAIPRGTPAKLSIDVLLDEAAGQQAFKASPLLKVCVSPATKAAAGNKTGNKPGNKPGNKSRAKRDGEAAWPRLAAAVVAAAAESVRRAGVFKRRSTVITVVVPPPEKALEAWQLEGWTLVEHHTEPELD